MEVGRVGRGLVAAAVVAVAADGGSYSLQARHSLAVGVWWLVACAFALRLGDFPGGRLGARLSLLAALGFAAVLAASVTWAPDREGAFLAFDRGLLYLGVGALAALTPRRRLSVWCDGFALGIGVVAVLALTSRLFPSVLPSHDLPQFLPGTVERLSYPVDYWNGLAVLLAMGAPLLLRAATTGSRAWCGCAAAAIPASASAIYLTGSRTGIVTLLIGVTIFVVFAADRWAALLTTFTVSVGAVVAILALHAHPVLVNGPIDDLEFPSQARMMAVLLVLICAATGGSSSFLQSRLSAVPRPRVGVGVAAAALMLALGIVLIALSNPRARLATFAQPPTPAALSQPDFVQSHLLSVGGGGRWQFWRAAVSEFESRPLLGGGGGSYESWWAEHGTLPVFVRYAHSLYLETLADLGLVGLALLLGALVCALSAGATALARARGCERTTIAALLAAAAAYLVAAGVDWMWQLTAVSIVGVACLGLLSTAGERVERAVGRSRPVARAAVVAFALLAIACEGVPLLTDSEVRASQAAVTSGDGAGAEAHARAAARLEPWAASPFVQLALVAEQNEHLRTAAAAIHAALRRNERDWRSWLVAARIETKLGKLDAARLSLLHAERLNPRSPIFGTTTAARQAAR